MVNKEESRAFATAVRILARRACFVIELRNKLRDRQYPTDVVEKVLERFRKLGYLNDAEHLLYLIQRDIRKGKGPRSIAYKLKSKLEKETMLTHYLEEHYPISLQNETMERILHKKIRSWHSLSSFEKKGKAFQFLMQRGFSGDVISSFLESCVLV